jgi:hypothetical protein
MAHREEDLPHQVLALTMLECMDNLKDKCLRSSSNKCLTKLMIS